MGKRRGCPAWAKVTSRGGLPKGCLDMPDPPDGSYPTGITSQRADFIQLPKVDDAAPAGCYSGCPAQQLKLQPKFTLFEWQSKKVTPLVRSTTTPLPTPFVAPAECGRSAEMTVATAKNLIAEARSNAGHSEACNIEVVNAPRPLSEIRVATEGSTGSTHGKRCKEKGKKSLSSLAAGPRGPAMSTTKPLRIFFAQRQCKSTQETESNAMERFSEQDSAHWQRKKRQSRWPARTDPECPVGTGLACLESSLTIGQRGPHVCDVCDVCDKAESGDERLGGHKGEAVARSLGDAEAAAAAAAKTM
eukprot:s2722_g5.t2